MLRKSREKAHYTATRYKDRGKIAEMQFVEKSRSHIVSRSKVGPPTEPRPSHQVGAHSRATQAPTAPGLSLRVSPKLKAVWAYRFRAYGGAEVSGTMGAVKSATETTGKTREGALVEFNTIYDRARSDKKRYTLAEGHKVWLQQHKNRRSDGPLAARTVETYAKAYERYLGACAAEGTSAATRDKPVSCVTTFCAQGPTLGLKVAPHDPRFSRVSLRCLLPRSLLAVAAEAMKLFFHVSSAVNSASVKPASRLASILNGPRTRGASNFFASSA